MAASRSGILFQCTERWVRAGLLGAVCVFVLLLSQACASADSSAGRAISSLPAGDPSYLYINFADADDIANRLQKSELIRMLVDQEPEFAELRSMLRNLPAKNVALMFSFDEGSRLRFQMAWSFKEDRRSLLEKIAKKTATADEVMGLLRIDPEVSLFEVLPPDAEGEEPFYKLLPMDLYVSAHEDVLIFGDEPERIAESVAAARNGAKRFSPKTEGDGRNCILFGLGREMTREVAGFYDILKGTERAETSPEPLAVEGNIELISGGWNLNLFTNAVAVIYGKNFADHMYVKPEGSFYAAGGGHLLAAIDSTPNLRQILTQEYASLLGAPFAKAKERLHDILDTATGEAEIKRLTDELLSIDRLNFAVTNDPVDMKKLRAYVLLSTRTGSMSGVGDAIATLVEKYDAKTAEKGKKSEIEIDKTGASGWKTVYTVEAPEGAKTKLTAGIDHITVAVDESRILAGMLSPEELTTPFTTDSNLYGELLANKTRLETIYFDIRGLRKTLQAFAGTSKLGRRDQRMLAMFMIPFMDFHEIGAETFSPAHFRFKFRTGWLDFDDRAYIDGLMK